MIRFITNTVRRDASRISLTNLATDGGSINNLVGGPRHLGFSCHWTMMSTQLNYDRLTSNTLRANCAVIAAGAHHLTQTNGWNLNWRTASLTSGAIPIVEAAGSTTWDSTTSGLLCGLNNQDMVLTFDQLYTGKDQFALAWNGSHASTVRTFAKLYFSEYCEWKTDEGFQVSIRPTWSDVTVFRHNYKIRETAVLRFTNISRDDIEAFHSQYRMFETPNFVYDPTGNLLAGKLWHCIIGPLQVQAAYDNFHTVNVTLYRLREY